MVRVGDFPRAAAGKGWTLFGPTTGIPLAIRERRLAAMRVKIIINRR